jgi:hypothetical protein
MRRLVNLSGAILIVEAVALLQSGVVEGHDGEHAFVAIPSLGQLAPTALAPRENVEYVGGHNGFTGGHVAIQGDRLYLGSYGRGLHIYDISDPAAPSFIGHYTPGVRADAPPDAAVFGGRHSPF